jgi:hypothetical protein
MNSVHILVTQFFKTHFNTHSLLRLGLPSISRFHVLRKEFSTHVSYLPFELHAAIYISFFDLTTLITNN